MTGGPIHNQRGLTKHVDPTPTVELAGIGPTTGPFGFRGDGFQANVTDFVGGTVFHIQGPLAENSSLDKDGLHAATFLVKSFDWVAFHLDGGGGTSHPELPCSFSGIPPLRAFGGPTTLSGISSVGFELYRGWFHGAFCCFHCFYTFVVEF